MTGRPNTYLNWTDGDPSKVQQPPGPLALQGWIAGQPPPFQYANYQLWLLDQWVQYLDQITNTSEPDQVIRLLNGGNWSWDLSTQTLAWSADANLAIAGVPDANNRIPTGSVVLNDGDVAYTTINPPIIFQGTSSMGTNVLTAVNFTGNITIGMTITGPGIPGGTLVTGKTPATVSMSANATSNNNNATYIASNVGPITVTPIANISFIPSLTTIMIARRSGAQVYLGVNTGQMLLRDGEFKPLLGSGYFDTYTAPAGQNLTAGQVVYISPGGSDAGRTAGALYPLDCSTANQAVRGTFAGVVISAYLTGQSATVVYSGFYAYAGLTPGANYYADPATPGGIIVGPITVPAGAKIVPVGFANTANSLIVTNANSIAGTFSQPIMKSESIGTGNGVITSFACSAQPLNSQSIFVWVDGIIQPNTLWSLVGQNVVFTNPPAAAQDVYVQYAEAAQAYIQGFQGVVGVGDGATVTFALPFVPINLDSLALYIDGEVQNNATAVASLNIGGGSATVTFNVAPAAAQDIYATGLSPVGASTFAGEITGGQNIGISPIGPFKQVSGSTMQFYSLLAGAGIALAVDGSGNIVITNTGGGGGGGAVTNGQFGAPVAINPAAGITPLNPASIEEEIWWVTPTGVTAGVNPITANPQIAAATIVGKRMTFFGVTNGSGGFLQISNGNGVLSSGDFRLQTGQCLVYVWDGTHWSFESNAI